MLVVGAIDAIPILAMITNDSIISKFLVMSSAEDVVSTSPLILIGSVSSKKTDIS